MIAVIVTMKTSFCIMITVMNTMTRHIFMMIRHIFHNENRNLYHDNRTPKDDNRNMDDESHILYHDNRICMMMRHEIKIDVPHCV